MPQVTLSFSDSVLAWTPSEQWIAPSRDDIDAWSYSTTKAQMEALRVNADQTTEAYYRAMLAAYRPIGWSVTDLGAHEHARRPGGVITPAQFMVEGLRAGSRRWALGAYDPADQMERLLMRLRSQPPPVAALLDWYWGNATISTKVHHMGMGPLISLWGSPDMLIIYYVFEAEIRTWGSWFEAYESSSFFARARLANIRLDLNIYNTHKAALQRELADAVSRRVRSTTLDL